MLILTRRVGETLRIGDDVSLMVLGVQGNQVRIGADAPKEVAVHREEIYRRIQQEKAGAEPKAPKTPAPKVQPEVTAGARFYSSDGPAPMPAAPKKKMPNVIIKRKRILENA